MGYRKLKIANVFIAKNFKRVFYGPRTLYVKDFRNARRPDFSGRVYVRYKNKYYEAFYDGRYTYNVTIR